jgi:2-succinyl-5-enolpyruvyl-6-hydroxy-3-cyclohexene-1-carboxylate synthase
VHLNFPLREPLTSEEELPADESGRGDGGPWTRREPGRLRAPGASARLRELARASERGLVVAGRDERVAGARDCAQAAGESAPCEAARDTRRAGAAAAAFCEAAGWPLLADPLSGGRRGGAAIAHYDLLLRDPGVAARLRPDLVIRVGDLPTSKPLRAWLAGLDEVPQVALDPEGSWQDPACRLSDSLAIDPVPALCELATAARGGGREWLCSWRDADALAADAIAATVAEVPISEPAVAAELGALLPQRATLFVASSMPVRDVETFWPVRADPPRVLCNRGASGIDGTVSSAFGAAAHEDGPVVLLIGDVALAHDVGGLLAARRLDLSVTIVLLDNGGGAIFDFLPVARARMARKDDHYTQHIATPTGLDFARAAELYGLAYERVGERAGFRAALERALAGGGSSIIEVAGDRRANRELHERVWAAASAALSPRATEAAPRA